MADILIRGMAMPKTCQICRTAKFDRIVGCEEWDRLSIAQRMYMRSETCPLVPLPEGHGDLIDLNAFRADNGLNAKCEHCPTNTYKCRHDMIHTKMDFCEMLDDAPVIVPAEGGTEDGD